MELILINENKLKIILSSNEMERLGLDENEFHLCLSNSRKILEQILVEYKQSDLLNFTKDAKLLLQLYPDKNGGCELYVTRLYIENSVPEDTIDENSFKTPLLPARLSKKENEHHTLCYSFINLSDVIAACRAIFKGKEAVESSLYIAQDKKPFLFIEASMEMNKKSPPFSVLSEFGELENSERAFLFLLERGNCLIKDGAIEILASL